MNRGDWQRLLHIKTYCEDIRSFIDRFGHDFEVFVSDRAYYNAVTMCILQIGELSNGLSEEYRELTKARMPWGMIRGMRNWLAHSYAEADERIIWETANNDIPKVLEFCMQETEGYRSSVCEPAMDARLAAATDEAERRNAEHPKSNVNLDRTR